MLHYYCLEMLKKKKKKPYLQFCQQLTVNAFTIYGQGVVAMRQVATGEAVLKGCLLLHFMDSKDGLRVHVF